MSNKIKTIDELNQLYFQAESVDRNVFAEQRSSILLIAGDHYNNKNSRQWTRIRDSKDLSQETKLRLTKNHMQKITKAYLNNLVSSSPNVKIIPRDEKSAQDRKCAELNQSVWEYCRDKMNFPMTVQSLGKDFIDCGETAVKIYWDPTAGDFVGYKQAVDINTGEPMLDENGQLKADENQPVFTGQLLVEQIHPFNLLRDPACTNMEKAAWLAIRKMVDIPDLKALVADDPEKLKIILPSERDEYMVFNTSQNMYQKSSNQALVVEYYFRPCPTYPRGYFYITTKHGVLFHGELPYGVFPIEYVGFDPVQTSARHQAIVKQLRPYQIEINRTASKIAEHQITSDDKILIQSGTKIASGGVLPGVRAIQYSGMAPTVLQGRAGEQYASYMSGQIDEMYQVANLMEEREERTNQEADPMAMFYRSVKDQRKFSLYVEKFEAYLKRIAQKYLALAKHYFSDDMLIPMIGKSEYVNIAEFKTTKDIFYSIKIQPMSDDVNTMVGKMMTIKHALQYVGNQLGKEDIGKMLRTMPFANFEESFSDMTLDYDLAENFILALERGENPQPAKSDNKIYMLKRLDKRMREPDFFTLPLPVQQKYAIAKQIYEEMQTMEMVELQRAQQGFIPLDGALIKTDLQIEIPNSTGGVKTTRAAFPVTALQWLQKQIEAQGTTQEMLQAQLSDAELATLAGRLNQTAPPGAQLGPAPVQGV